MLEPVTAPTLKLNNRGIIYDGALGWEVASTLGGMVCSRDLPCGEASGTAPCWRQSRLAFLPVAGTVSVSCCVAGMLRAPAGARCARRATRLGARASCCRWLWGLGLGAAEPAGPAA